MAENFTCKQFAVSVSLICPKQCNSPSNGHIVFSSTAVKYDSVIIIMKHISSAAKLLVNFSLLADIVFKILLNLGWEICFYQKSAVFKCHFIPRENTKLLFNVIPAFSNLSLPNPFHYSNSFKIFSDVVHQLNCH